jgi:hypothetical protein
MLERKIIDISLCIYTDVQFSVLFIFPSFPFKVHNISNSKLISVPDLLSTVSFIS